jgi:hypothetical protein
MYYFWPKQIYISFESSLFPKAIVIEAQLSLSIGKCPQSGGGALLLALVRKKTRIVESRTYF